MCTLSVAGKILRFAQDDKYGSVVSDDIVSELAVSVIAVSDPDIHVSVIVVSDPAIRVPAVHKPDVSALPSDIPPFKFIHKD